MLDFNKLYNENNKMVLRYLTSKTKNYADAEELTNDIFLKVFKHLENFDETKSSFTTWLINISKNTLIDYYRLKGGSNKAKAFKNCINTDNAMTDEIYQVFQIPDKGIKSDSLYDTEIVINNTSKAINGLKGIAKDIAVEFFYNDLTYDEIQNKLDLPMGTVKGTINRVRIKLQCKLQKELDLV